MKLPIQYISKVPNWVWLGSAAAVVLYIIKKGGVQNAAAGVTAGVINSAGNIVSGAAQGVVVGAGGLVGIPETNLTKCQQSILNAKDLDASKFCTASQFVKWQYLSSRQRLTGKTFTINDIFN